MFVKLNYTMSDILRIRINTEFKVQFLCNFDTHKIVPF